MFKKAADYLEGAEDGRFAFVSTNSICQGRPVEALFGPLFDEGWRISYAWPSFVWRSDALAPAHVHVVIVGMDKKSTEKATLHHDDGSVTECESINPYLIPGEVFFVNERRKPLSGQLAPATYGTKPADHGCLQIKSEDDYELAMSGPIARKYVRRRLGADEVTTGKKTWLLWLDGADPDDMRESPFLLGRVNRCREWRLAQSKSGDAYKLASTPHLFRPNTKRPTGPYLCIPIHTSGKREYVTAEFVEDGAIATNACFTMDDPDGFSFAVLSSSLFMLWQDTVGGRMKSDNRFANTLVWNTFPLPSTISDAQRKRIANAGRKVISARRSYGDKSLDSLYDPLTFGMYTELKAAHDELDACVRKLYGLSKTEVKRMAMRLRSRNSSNNIGRSKSN